MSRAPNLGQHFSLADNFIAHVKKTVGTDPFITTRYIGFVAVSAVTVYELAIKDIYCCFGENKNAVFGNFVAQHFYRINGRIKLDDIKDRHLNLFGEKYKSRFLKKLYQIEQDTLKRDKVSIKASYGNIIRLRHLFAHEGIIPGTVSLEEALTSYELGKHVIYCLNETMRR